MYDCTYAAVPRRKSIFGQSITFRSSSHPLVVLLLLRDLLVEQAERVVRGQDDGGDLWQPQRS